MSVDPLTGGVAAPNIAAIIAGELAALAADAQTLGARLSPGDVVQAVVLPSNGLTDLLEIGGLRVAAELPPTLSPGETIVVTVTGFSGDRINLQIVSTLKSDAGEREAPTEPPPLAGERPRTANGLAGPSAPPAARAQASAPATQAGPRMTTVRAVQPAPSALRTIEARLAAAHAMTSPIAPPPASGAGGARTPPGSAGRAPSSPASPGRPLIGVRPPLSSPAPPPAAPPPRGLAAFTAPASPTSAPASPPSAPATPPAAAPAAAEVPRGLAAFTEPVALLRALGLPVTATNVASARMALESPQKLPNALATLERALANPTDPRVATLSTLTSFLARLDPRSPVFATQIAAFVDHVVTGSEAKIAHLLQASDEAAPAVAANAISAPRTSPELPAGPQSNPPPLALERVAVARAALDYDLKTQLLALAADRASSPDAATPKAAAFDGAVAGALTAITALQLNAAAGLDANPGGLAFSLPVALPDGVAYARVRIGRDAPEGSTTPLDGNNFHLAFVLETRHLGTIGIDVVTVGRAVTLSVKTEAVRAQRVFGSALGDLTARLEKLHYRVAKADAVVAPLAADATEAPSRPVPDADPARLVDVDA